MLACRDVCCRCRAQDAVLSIHPCEGSLVLTPSSSPLADHPSPVGCPSTTCTTIYTNPPLSWRRRRGSRCRSTVRRRQRASLGTAARTSEGRSRGAGPRARAWSSPGARQWTWLIPPRPSCAGFLRCRGAHQPRPGGVALGRGAPQLFVKHFALHASLQCSPAHCKAHGCL